MGGLREATAAVAGRGVYGALKYESGVHRVQVPPALLLYYNIILF